ncbi:MAG: RimK family alpha-L-glutamate ligase [Candidatus Zixiibacteriota bacterium]
MGKLGIFVERYTISSSLEMNALMRLSLEARKLGHRVDFLFRPDMYKIPEYDAIFIRALTDPLNSAYVAARTAEIHGVKVIDDPDSIRICCDKVCMYSRLVHQNIPIPDTRIVERHEINEAVTKKLLAELGKPLVLKAPNSSFSKYVEKAESVKEFLDVAKRFVRRADRIVVQRFVKSSFDWRVGVLGGEPLYVCQYGIPKRRWKILTHTAGGRTIEGTVHAVPIKDAPQELLDVAVAASNAIGGGLYGVDLKQVDNGYIVIEVNDNPTINAGDEDQANSEIYERLIKFLLPS